MAGSYNTTQTHIVTMACTVSVHVYNCTCMNNINVLTDCLIFCSSGDSLLLTQYLNSKSPLFSIVKLLVLLLVMTMHPKLTSLKGETEYL